MDLENLLAGGFIGTVVTQVMSLISSNISFKREKAKIFYGNKLAKGELLLGYYVGIYFYLRTIVSIFEKCMEMMDNIDLDIDHDSMNELLIKSWNSLLEFEYKILNDGSSAYLYYDIKNEWTDVDFGNLFNLSNTVTPKINNWLAYLNNNEEEHPLAIALKSEILSDLQNVIDSLNKYKNAADATIEQLKSQAKK